MAAVPATREEISLLAVPIHGGETSANGRPLAPGVHLRWSMHPWLRYPTRGFLIERYVESGEFSVENWEPLATVKSPTLAVGGALNLAQRAKFEALHRIRDSLGGAFGNYDERLADVVDFIIPRWPLNDQFIGAPTNDQPELRARKLDLLNLAMLDPRVALALGFHYIDTSVPPGVRARYRVTGQWRATSWSRISQNANTLRASDVRPGSVNLGIMTLRSDRQLSLTTRGSRAVLALEGSGALPLELALPEDVTELSLSIRRSVSAPISVVAYLENGQAIIDAHVRQSSRNVLVTSPRRDIHTVELRQPAVALSTWHISSVGCRMYTGTIGDLYAEAEVDVTAPPLPAVDLVHARQVDAPGPVELRPNRPSAAAASELTFRASPDLSRRSPLIHVQRWSARGATYEHRTESVDVAPLPQLLISARLDGTDSNVQLFASAALGATEFNRSRLVIATQDGYARVNTISLASLGQSLAFAIWVFVAEESSVRAVIDHDWQHSFWLGLTEHPGRLRLWLNGQRFESSGLFPTRKWFHVAVVYDGHSVTFYVDGQLDSTHEAVLGSVHRGTGSYLYLGGGPGSGGSTSFPLHGYVSSLQVYRLAVPSSAGVDQLASWPFAHDGRSLVSGTDAEPVGAPRFVADHPEQTGQNSVELDGSSWFRVPGLHGLADLDTELMIQAWVKPESGQSWPTIVGNRFDTSLWFGLTSSDYRLRLRVNGQIYDSNTGLPANAWSHVAATYDSSEIVFCINGYFDGRHVARIGPIVSSRGTLTIGSDDGDYPFRGRLCDVRLTQGVPSPSHPALLTSQPLVGSWALDDSVVDGARSQPSEAVGKITFVNLHPIHPDAKVGRFNGGQLIHVPSVWALRKITNRFTIDAWINPEAVDNTPTIVGYDWRNGFWLGLAQDRRVRFYINGHRYESNSRISLNRWNRVTVGYDSNSVRFYVNQRERVDVTHGAAWGSLNNAERALSIGAEAHVSASDAGYFFRGLLSDVRIWAEFLTPREADESALRGKPPNGDYLDRGLPSGRYGYRVAAVDLVGRRGPFTPTTFVTVSDRTPPPPPLGVRARFLPLSGVITAISNRDDDGRRLRLHTDIVLSGVERRDGTLFVPPTATQAIERLTRYDVEVSETGNTGARRETHLVRAATYDADGNLLLDVEQRPLSRLEPATGHRVSIDFDTELEVRWAWSGWHRLSAPDVREFRLYRREGATDTVEATVEAVSQHADSFSIVAKLDRRPMTGAPADWVGHFCRVGAHRYRITSASLTGTMMSAELEYQARPIQRPTLGAPLVFAVEVPSAVRDDAAEWSGPRLVVPADEESPTHTFDTMTLDAVSDEDFAALERDFAGRNVSRTGLLSFILPAEVPIHREDEPPGALIAYSMGGDNHGWRAFRVKAHRMRDDGRTLLYLTDDSFRGDPITPLHLTKIRYLRGFWMRCVLPVTPNVSATVATRAWQVAITAADRADTPDHRGEAGVTGNESALSTVAQAIAVDRQRPPAPEAPHVTIDAADYFGEARATVSWAHLSIDAPQVEVHRSTDSAIFAEDMKRRRQRTGSYSAERYPEVAEVMDDDENFVAWLSARFPEMAASWTSALFVPKSDPRYAAASEVWRAWSERYYPRLTETDVQALAELPGNEAAFAIVTSPPISGSQHVDIIRGLARNGFSYRLRPRSASHIGSVSLGRASLPVKAVQILPPRQPVISKVVAGERTIQLDWPINAHPELASYWLYRADTPDELDDLRWFGDGADPRVVATIEDPLIRVRAGVIELPAGVTPPDLAAVYLLEDYDSSTAPDAQIRALDVASELERLPDGTPLVVTARRAGAVVALGKRGPAPPYADTVFPYRDYAYRLVAVDRNGNRSAGSPAIVARAFDTTPPEPPVWESAAWRSPSDETPFVALRWHTEEPGLRCLLERKSERDDLWRAVTGFSLHSSLNVAGPTPRFEYEARDSEAESAFGHIYRVKVVNAANRMNERFVTISVPPTA